MNFRQFIEESEGTFGKPNQMNPISNDRNFEKKTLKPDVAKKGTTVGRMMSAGPKITTPSKPAKFSNPNKSMTVDPNKFKKPKPTTVKSPNS